MERKTSLYFNPYTFAENEKNMPCHEQRELCQFFGVDIGDLEVSGSLRRAVRHLATLEIGNMFKPVFFPNISVAKDISYPGWKTPVSDLYWSLARNGVLDNPQETLGGFWALCETTPKPEFEKILDPVSNDFNEGTQLYPNDFLEDILSQIRKDNLVQLSPKISLSSRFGYSHNDVTETVIPEIAKALDIDANTLRLPSAVEYNYLANRGVIRGRSTSTAEWMGDTALCGKAGVMGGYMSHGAIGYQGSTKRAHEDGLPWIGFRLMMVP